jgi:hypothetical protein
MSRELLQQALVHLENACMPAPSFLAEIRAHLAAQAQAKPLEFLMDGARFKLNFNAIGNCTTFQNLAHELQGRWVALVGAENDKHMAAQPLHEQLREMGEAHAAQPAPAEPVALESVHLTRDTSGMCTVRVNGRVAIRDNGDIIDHMATLEWFAAQPAPVPKPVPVAWGAASADGKIYIVWHERTYACTIPLYTHPAAPVPVPLTQAATDVLAERKRQVEVEGWTPDHDDAHKAGGMAVAAACYAAWSLPSRPASETVAVLWPWTGWAQKWFKPKDTRRNLIRAAALLLAEIERLDRARIAASPEKP